MITDKDGGLVIDVKVIPRSSRNKIELEGDSIRLKITAPPVDGEANSAVIEFLSGLLDVPKRNISIQKGATSKNKTIRILAMSKDSFTHKIQK